jgi:5'-3' exonuclease
MGIPSYFRKLVGQYKGLIRRDKPGGAVGWLMFDFNCLVYHVLARPDCPVYSADRHEVWEGQFLDEVARYALKVIRAVEPTAGVYIAVDGVAPMAKIRQQRMRRFKGTSVKQGKEADAAAAAAEPRTSWDKNAITPGTRFMEKLSARLQRLIGDHQPAGQRWLLSDATEAGEGEQKIMGYIRKGMCGGAANTDSVVVYGLDADLIVLSMWTRTEVFPDRPMWLFRERVERGEMIRDATGEEMFEWFSVAVLENAISQEGGVAELDAGARREWVQDYCAAMMLLGNDFLPTSMTFRLKENGHGRLLDMLGKARRAAGGNRLWAREGGLNLAGWTAAVRYLSNAEEDRFLRAVQKKLEARGDDTDPEDEPLRVRADAVFLDAGAGPETMRLRADWRKVYADLGFGGNVRGAVDTYIQGMRWVVDYYTGVPVNMEWVYPWHFAPLWEHIYMGLVTGGWRAVPAPGLRTLQPIEQLAMVLPQRSWGLIRADATVARLPALAPHWFPEGFALNSVGKRYAWECEPEIPIPLPAQVWALI